MTNFPMPSLKNIWQRNEAVKIVITGLVPLLSDQGKGLGLSGSSVTLKLSLPHLLR
jgi:hypothetical protein